MLMNARVITGIVSFSLALTGLFLANMFLAMMIGEISRKRQDGSLVSYFGFTFPKMWRIFGEYPVHIRRGNCMCMRWPHLLLRWPAWLAWRCVFV